MKRNESETKKKKKTYHQYKICNLAIPATQRNDQYHEILEWSIQNCHNPMHCGLEFYIGK